MPRDPQDERELTADLDAFHRVRALTQALTASLSPEDMVLQSMPDASPTKWHLAHTSWFFETFLLSATNPGYRPYDPRFRTLFNSYYDAVGPQPARDRRAQSRPSLGEVLRYRAHVDEALPAALQRLSGDALAAARTVLTLGLNHEQQHQELLLTDIQHALFSNPLHPAFGPGEPAPDDGHTPPLGFVPHPGGLCQIGVATGANGSEGFTFDNEGPRHQVFLEPFALGTRLVTNGEYLAFVHDGGYQRPELWLSEGFHTRQRQGWVGPLYWDAAGSTAFTLFGDRPLALAAPVAHLSYFEADAFARWAGARLPTEAEWEVAAQGLPVQGNFLDEGRLAPRVASPGDGLQQLFGDVWEWTQSPYVPYPRYQPAAGALGEYNGKFMVNQLVLRGGSAFTPRAHVRASYRNFFPPAVRWQLSGLRLARDLI